MKDYSYRKRKVYQLLKGIETGDPQSVKVVNESKYIQHNPQTQEGGEGLAVLFKRLSLTNPKVEVVRLFEDSDYVFGHTIYDFASVRIGFEVFRFEGDYIVEHWDNIQSRVGDMVGGSTEIQDLQATEINRLAVSDFLQQVFVGRNFDNISRYLDLNKYVEHSTLTNLLDKPSHTDYRVNHRLLAEGNFVLAVTEGYKDDRLTSFYDLFRLKLGKIVEHWDTTEAVPPLAEWKNQNGKF